MASQKILSDSSRINARISRNRNKYFERLYGIAYLDHAAAAQYSDLHMKHYVRDLTCSLYGNPHSDSDSSVCTTDVVNSVRERILKYFNTTSQEYTVIFTRNCTGALHLLADAFQLQSIIKDQTNSDSESSEVSTEPKCRSCKSVSSHTAADGAPFVSASKTLSISYQEMEMSAAKLCSKCNMPTIKKRQSFYVYLDDNHTSVLGIRAIMADRGAKICCTTPAEVRKYFLLINDDTKDKICMASYSSSDECQHPMQSEYQQTNNLFAYPAQSNFNGCRYPLPWTNQIRRHVHCTETSCNRWFVLLDAAAMLTTSTVDLSLWQPDFMTLSFYKMFGFPTGVGALIVKNSSSHVLKRTYFGGGTVELLFAHGNHHVSRRDLSDRLEDGTLPFLEIVAIKHGFDSLETVAGTTKEISIHAFSLARFVYFELSRRQHANGKPVVVLYHDDKTFSSMETQGPIVNFNFLRPDGSYIGYSEVGKLAPIYGIHLRTGCFCNTGRCQLHLQLTDEKMRQNHKDGHSCGNHVDTIDGRPMGSVRISFGFSSTLEDCHTFLNFVFECFVDAGTDADVQLGRFDSTTATGCDETYWSAALEPAIPVRASYQDGQFMRPAVGLPGIAERGQRFTGSLIPRYKCFDNDQNKQRSQRKSQSFKRNSEPV